MELNQLREEVSRTQITCFLTTLGLHEQPGELERELLQRINKAQEKVDKVIVVYGGKF